MTLFYNDRLDPEDQVDMEERISREIFHFSEDCIRYQDDSHEDLTLTEEDCNDLGRAILLMVLAKFRPDLVEKE